MSTITQRVFDALETDRGITIDEIAKRARVVPESAIAALGRLRQQRAMHPASCVDGIWLYRRRKDAIRPSDGRGNLLRQMRREAA